MPLISCSKEACYLIAVDVVVLEFLILEAQAQVVLVQESSRLDLQLCYKHA